MSFKLLSTFVESPKYYKRWSFTVYWLQTTTETDVSLSPLDKDKRILYTPRVLRPESHHVVFYKNLIILLN